MLSRDFDRDHAFRMNWGHRYQTSAENLEWCKTLTGAPTYTNLQALMLMRIVIQSFSAFGSRQRLQDLLFPDAQNDSARQIADQRGIFPGLSLWLQ